MTGTYQWVATYSGDANNIGVGQRNRNEPVVVSSGHSAPEHDANPSDGTLSSGPCRRIDRLGDAHRRGNHANGTITFDLYGPDG